MTARKLDLVLLAAAVAALLAIGSATAMRGAAGISGWPLAIHVGAKWLLLGATVWTSLRNANALGKGTPIGRAWLWFGLGVGAYLVGELGEAFYQLVLHVLNPFPSLLDVFYVAGYPLLIAALVGFMRAYSKAGYPMGSPRGSALLGGGLVVAGVAAVWPVLAPIFRQAGPLLERTLAVAYPLLDVALLVAVALLLRGTSQFGGGHAWESWALLLAGLAVMIAGDLRYAYFAAGGAQHVDPISESCFVVAYLLLARGASKQRQLVEA
jgi:uncharacterized membrane protein